MTRSAEGKQLPRSDALALWLMRLGVALLAAAFVSGLFVGLYANPRAGLAAHVIGITGALMLIAFGLLWSRLALGRAARLAAFWMLIVSVPTGFVAQLVGAALGLSRMFVVTAAGRPEGLPALETAVELVTKAITPLTILPVLIVLVGLRRPD